jgi:ribosome maturation factor RimP
LERPVQKNSDFERFCGYRARVQLEKDAPGRRRFTGTLKPADTGFIQMDVDGEEIQLALELVEKAHLLLEIDEHRALVEQSLEVHATGDSA